MRPRCNRALWPLSRHVAQMYAHASAQALLNRRPRALVASDSLQWMQVSGMRLASVRNAGGTDVVPDTTDVSPDT
ncbi:hypothetical protein WME75_31695 [Sorangium sp. So ce1014]|uniref:hypothetical protein n=1 Tax=Sorangium sp. So ce1014 TaxID=3133326 RepID=UPI003F6271ED